MVFQTRVRFNVAGNIYETFLETLNRYPDTLLGDSSRRINFFDSITQVYFFNRSPAAFEAVLYFYQSNGCLIRPPFLPMELFECECKFYDLAEKYVKSMKKREGFDYCPKVRKKVKNHTFLQKLWQFLEEPDSSLHARIFHSVSLVLVFFVVVVDCFSTLETFRSGSFSMVINAVTFSFNIFFALEMIARLVSAPSKLKFLRSIANALDFFSIFVSLPLLAVENKNGAILSRCLRMFRVFRLIRVYKSCKTLLIVLHILASCIKELVGLLFYMMVSFTIFGSIIYLAELDDKTSPVNSVPEGMWLAMQTMVTLGYGDIIPVTMPGKLLTAFCAAIGVVITIPLLSLGGKYFALHTKTFKITIVDCETL